jgi:hypothetical protein
MTTLTSTTNRTLDTSTTPPRPSSPAQLMLHTVLPVAVGILAAVVIGAEGGTPSALMVCAAIYLFAAAVGRPASAWWAFAGAMPFIALGVVFDNEWLSLLALGTVQVFIVVIGWIRGRLRERHTLPQTLAAGSFAVLAIAAAAGAPTVAAFITIAGLIAHGAWDVVHHRTGAVVARSYSAFCAGLDVALAAAVAVALATTA